MSTSPQHLPPAERRDHFEDVAAPDSAALWAMYRNAKARAEESRRNVKAAIVRAVERGASITICHHAIDDYCRADRALADAAQTLVDCLELPDGGRGEGVVFTLELAPKEGAR